MSRGSNIPFSYTGFIAARDTPKIATSGALIIGAKCNPPIPPKLDIVKQPPCKSFGDIFPSLALLLNCVISVAISNDPFLSTSLRTVTHNPFLGFIATRM